MSAQPLEIRMAYLEGVFEQLDKRPGDLNSTLDGRFAQIDSRFAQVDARFAQVDARFVQVDTRIDDLGHKVGGLQWRLTSLVVVTWIATILAILLKH